MADVTDAAFRRVIAKYGKPDVTWTEFVSADGLCSPGRTVLKRDLEYTEAERPIVAQLFTAHPEKMREAAQLVAELGFDGLDINMGCPDRSIEKQGAGAAMMQNPEAARAVIRAAKAGIKDAGKDIPVSVKTRVGWNKVELDTWVPELLAEDLAALTIHARTRKEMSLVPARWGHVAEVVAMRDKAGVSTLILGNGDVKDLDDARHKAEETGADGIMLGRAVFGNPWLFTNRRSEGETFARHEGLAFATSPISIKEKLRVMVEHTKLFEELLGDIKSFAIMKKHYKAYVNGFDRAKELRTRLMEEAQNAADVEKIVEEWLDKVA